MQYLVQSLVQSLMQRAHKECKNTRTLLLLQVSTAANLLQQAAAASCKLLLLQVAAAAASAARCKLLLMLLQAAAAAASRLPNQFPGCVAACSGAFLLTLPSINGLKQKAVLFADASLVCLCKRALHMIMALQIPAQPITLASMLPLSAGEPTHSLSKLAQLNSSSLPNLRARTYVLNKTFSFANTSPFPKWGRPCTIEFQGAQMGSREP